jgi:hypothetical protein
MSKRKYSKMSDKIKITHYECTNKKCKWQGTDHQKINDYLGYGRTELICPKCRKNEFYGLLPSYVDSISSIS